MIIVGGCIKIDRNFECFWPPIFFMSPLKFLDLHYKTHPVFDHVAKLHGDRPRDLGDFVAKKTNIE